MDESTRMLLGLVIGITVMVVLVSKTKVHTFIALMITAIQEGFGSTLKSTGIIIGLALAMGAGLQLTHCLVPPTPEPTTAASMLGGM